jgi:hypothetical protein
MQGMPFKGIHGHTRHTHEDKVEEKKKKTPQPGVAPHNNQPAVLKEIDLYNHPFTPFTPQRPAHYVAVFTLPSCIHLLLT